MSGIDSSVVSGETMDSFKRRLGKFMDEEIGSGAYTGTAIEIGLSNGLLQRSSFYHMYSNDSC